MRLGLGLRLGISYKGVKAAQPLLLDTYSGAAAAYSLRKLSNDYEGDAIRVRRSSDNAEQDIGFIGGELDTTTLTAFVGAGDGFVTTWYDQSGNTNNATQATASNQPLIVNAGSVIHKNGKPAVHSVSDQFMACSSNLNANPMYSFIVFENGSSSSLNQGIAGQWAVQNDWIIWGKYFSSPEDIGASSFNTSGVRTNLQTGGVLGSNDYRLLTTVFDNVMEISSNGSVIGTSGAITDVRQGGQFAIMNYSSTNPSLSLDDTKYQEFIFFTSDKSSEQSEIETNINNRYNIY